VAAGALLHGGAARLGCPGVRAELESARREWDEAYRRFEQEARDPANAAELHGGLRAVTNELRRRLGSAYTVAELAAVYRGADDWARDAVGENPPGPGWLGTLSIVEGAAFLLYSRGAVDFEP
jgi:hypothetical protein